jgi:hypothetical protein
MLIQVKHTGNRFGYVKDFMLHDLIESGDIKEFKRSTGWVTVGVDSLRQSKRPIEPKSQSRLNKIVRVIYDNNSHDYVSDRILDILINSNKIVKFESESGWVTL